MFGLRSALGRAILASIVLLLLIGSLGGVALWRTHNNHTAVNAMGARSRVVADLEYARFYSLFPFTEIITGVSTGAPLPTKDAFDETAAAVEENLAEARQSLVAFGETEQVRRLDAISAVVIPLLRNISDWLATSDTVPLEANQKVVQQGLNANRPQVETAMTTLGRLSDEQQQKLNVETAAAKRSADSSLFLIAGLGIAAFLTAAGTLLLFTFSVIRPLGPLQKVARAAAEGDMDTRAAVTGPTEIRALARSFNAMVEARKKTEETLRRLASTDSLTGLANHGSLHEILEREIQRGLDTGQPLAVLMMDLDGFKLFNDTYGHQEGDRVLSQVASVLVAQFGDSGIVGRYGGDEFMVILPNTDRSAAVESGNKLLEAIAEERLRPRHGSNLPVMLSIGLSLCPDDAKEKEELIAYADSSLFEAKQLSGSTLVVAHRDPVDSFAKQRTPFGVLDALVRAVDRKDRYTRLHSQQDAEYAVALGKAIGLTDGTLNSLRVGGLLHDVGKIGVPDEILKKPGPLTEDETAIMREHVVLSNLIVHGVPNLQDVSDSVYSHHERWDGEGYPRGLKGEEIPIAGRIMGIVDAYSAMILDRPYRKALSHQEAIAELRKCSGTQFDPNLIEAFIQIIETQSQAAA